MLNFIKSYATAPPEVRYHDFIKDKNVVIVGPSPWLNNRNMGETIDSYDIVVRINQGIFLPKTNSKDYGSRTDIIYTSQRARDEYGMNFPPEYNSVKFIALLIQTKQPDFPAIKCFVCNAELKQDEEYCLNKEWLHTETKKLGHSSCIHPDIDYSKYPIPIVKRDLAKYTTLYRSSLLSGMLAVIDMLQFHAAKINIIGFDFYDGVKTMMASKDKETKGSEIYCTGYSVFTDTMRLSHKDQDGKQLFLLKTLMQEFSCISIDENLTRIMKERLTYTNISTYNEEYKDYIANKKIIVVGPGPFLSGKGLGVFVDSFDIVVRINLGSGLCKNFSNDFGKRTDVIYVNQLIRKEFGLELPTSIPNGKSNFYCVQSFVTDNEKCSICKEAICGECYVEEKQSNLRYSHWSCVAYTDYRLIPEKVIILNSTSLKNYVKELPLIGLSAIIHLLSFKPKSIHVTGFDFYDALKHNKGNIPITELYAPQYNVLEPVSIETKDMKNNQLKTFKKICNKNKDIITLDDKLQKLCYH